MGGVAAGEHVSERRGVTELIGDGLREAGVLIAVFGMLDEFVHGEGPTRLWSTVVLTIRFALVCGRSL